MELTGWVKNYGWGRKGINSAVAQLAMANDPDFRLNEEETYAEMWMGTHVCGVSVVKETGETLDRVLKKDLSYLFKVLSINKALSIQVHPNKCEAERLHRSARISTRIPITSRNWPLPSRPFWPSWDLCQPKISGTTSMSSSR